MFSYQFYNLVHIIGLVLLMIGLTGIFLNTNAQRTDRMGRRVPFLFHGLGVFLILLGGFGMLARLGIVHGASWPGWIWVKVAVWALLAIAALLPLRFPRTALPLLLLLPMLGGLAAYMAIYKPF
ncbi:hypothetical protein BH23GEM6_BH23GEM6_07430 [soil metagenome]